MLQVSLFFTLPVDVNTCPPVAESAATPCDSYIRNLLPEIKFGLC
jgi:hypothetical protein